MANNAGGMDVRLVNLRFGSHYHQGTVWTHNETDFIELGDIDGAHMCYVDPTSISGYIVPSMMLMAAGVDPFENYEIIGSHPGVIEALYDPDGVCEAGAAYFDARDPLEGVHPDVKEVVLELDTSPPIPNDSFSFAADLPDALREALVSALLEIGSTEEGLAWLAVMGGGSEGLVETGHDLFSGLVELIDGAGFEGPFEVFEYYFH